MFVGSEATSASRDLGRLVRDRRRVVLSGADESDQNFLFRDVDMRAEQ